MKEKIAIIGMSSLFPGSKTLQEFWNNLMDKKDLTGMATKDDFGADPVRSFLSIRLFQNSCSVLE